jgi:hypothetical protein
VLRRLPQRAIIISPAAVGFEKKGRRSESNGGCYFHPNWPGKVGNDLD